MESSVLKQLNTLPNLLTCSRFILAPILLWLAWQGYETAFFIVLAITFLTDVLDGFTARLLNQSSELGARLDTLADLVVYTILAISVWWLWPDIIQREITYVLLVIGSYISPILIGFIKFHTLTSYHTWLVKLAVVLLGLSFFILFIFDLAWPFHVAALVCALAAIEEIAISFSSDEIQSDIPSLWHLLRH
ncbi:CDP-alcohol phosphatidyltransferase [Methylophaga sp. 42_25_T18]|nr:CDP-alcohol phosphatidyltransferase [Methylophaga sp. 42_25_T18]OUR89751.1 CDP-alcohol phosphatidyltransferase [Methylophaga sp. 42_8_T64]